MTDFTTPETRQDLLARRLAQGETLRLATLASELGVSLDTLRRDLAALERMGQARRIRGGALPVAPTPPLARRGTASPLPPALLARAVQTLADATTLLLDGGTSVLALARALDNRPDRLVVTPAPHVAAATHAAGIATVALGGPLSLRGGAATGATALAALDDLTADVAVLGACGLDAEFGLTADDLPEAEMKRAMARASARTIVVTGAARLGTRARHRVLPPEAIDLVVTDADADAAAPFLARDIAVLRP